jgi:hypothetical protein
MGPCGTGRSKRRQQPVQKKIKKKKKMLQKNENENAEKKWREGLEKETKKNGLELRTTARYFQQTRAIAQKKEEKMGFKIRNRKHFYGGDNFYYYYKGGRGTTQPATGTTKHWQFFLNSVCCTGSTKIFLNSVWT